MTCQHHTSTPSRRRRRTIRYYNKPCVSMLASFEVVSSDSRSAEAENESARLCHKSARLRRGYVTRSRPLSCMLSTIHHTQRHLTYETKALVPQLASTAGSESTHNVNNIKYRTHGVSECSSTGRTIAKEQY